LNEFEHVRSLELSDPKVAETKEKGKNTPPLN